MKKLWHPITYAIIWSISASTLLALALPTSSADTTPTTAVFVPEYHHSNGTVEYKYFKEPGNDDYLGHYDVRFFKGLVSNDQRTETLTLMMRAYLAFFNEAGLDTWIAHGTLLGWWWNGEVSFSSFSGLVLKKG